MRLRSAARQWLESQVSCFLFVCFESPKLNSFFVCCLFISNLLNCWFIRSIFPAWRRRSWAWARTWAWAWRWGGWRTRRRRWRGWGGGDLTTQEAMAVHQLKFFSRTLSTGLFIIVWDNQVKVFYISRGRPDVSRGGQIIPTISIKSRNLLHFSRNSLPLYISRGTKPYQDNIFRGNKPYHRNISRGNIPVWYTFENTQYQQMQPMWFCIFSNRWFEETFEKTQRRKAKQMQPIWLCLFSSRTFKDTFEKTQVKKSHFAVCLFCTFMSC